MPGEAAEREWKGRLYPMRIKKAGLSVVPAEAEVPTLKVGDLLTEIAAPFPNRPWRWS